MSFFHSNELLIWLCLGFTLIIIAVKGGSSTRIALDITKVFKDMNTSDGVQKGKITVGSSVDSYQTAFLSMNNSVHSLDTSQENGTSLRFIENDLEIVSFHQISTQRFLVSDKNSVKIYQLSDYMNDSTAVETLVCKGPGCCPRSNSRCRENESFVLGPTAVDHRSSSKVAYYVDDTTIYSISLSTNEPAKSFKFDCMNIEASALAFDDKFSMALIFCGNTKNAYSIDLQSKKTTPIPFYGNQTISIKQTTMIGKNLFLCCTRDLKLLLLNIKTGRYSYIHEGMTDLPGVPSESNRKIIEVSHMADIKYKGYLLALGRRKELIQLNYKVTSIPNESSGGTPVSSEKASSDRGENAASIDDVIKVIGCAAAVAVLVVGITIVSFALRYKRKKRQLIRKYTHHQRRQRRPPVSDRVIEDIQLSTFRERGVERREDQLKVESVNKTNSTRSTKENPVKDSQSPLQPNQRRQPPVHMDQDMDSVGGLEDVDRPYAQPREQNSNIKLTTFGERDVEQRKDQLNGESVNTTNVTNYSKENLIKDRPPFLLLNQHRKSLVQKDLKDSTVEPYHVAVLDPADRLLTTHASVPSTPYVRPRLSLLPCDRNLDPEQNSNFELTTFSQRYVEQRKDQLNEESIIETTEAAIREENLVKHRPPLPLPNQLRQPPSHKGSKDSSAEPYYVEVLDHVDRSTHTKTMVTEPLNVRPRLSLPPCDRSLDLLGCKQHSDYLTPSHSPVMAIAGPRSEQSPYCDTACDSPVHSTDYDHYSYAHEPPKASETTNKQEDDDQKTSNPLQDIAFTITSGKMDIAVQCKFKES